VSRDGASPGSVGIYFCQIIYLPASDFSPKSFCPHGISLLVSGLPARYCPGLMEIVNLNAAPPFMTKDGSEIRELLAYRNSAIRNQSLAEARLPAGASTQEHYHAKTEEIYFITSGQGRMRIEGELAEVKAGDAIAIPPGKEKGPSGMVATTELVTVLITETDDVI